MTGLVSRSDVNRLISIARTVSTNLLRNRTCIKYLGHPGSATEVWLQHRPTVPHAK